MEYQSRPQEVEEPSLMDLLSALWRQRTAIVCTMLVSVLLAVVVIAGLFVTSPRSETVALPFRLLFPGALDGRYPNGQRFQPADISAASVVSAVVERLGLEQFASYSEIKAAISVVESNPALARLRREYEARLSNARLTQAERAALEEEYEAKRNSARGADFVIQIQRDRARLPNEVLENFMQKILQEWAEEAMARRGAWTYDIPIPGRGMFDQASVEEEDYLIAVDMARSALARLETAAQLLLAIPGSNLVRATGSPNLSLVELRARIDDLRRFKISPLLARIRIQGSFRDRHASTIYIQDQLYNLQRQARALSEKGDSVDRVLGRLRSEGLVAPRTGDPSMSEGGGVVIPQFNEGFLNRLMTLGAETTDVDYRRELSNLVLKYQSMLVELQKEESFYQEILDSMERFHDGQDLPGTHALESEEVERRFSSIMQDIYVLIDQLQFLHQEISLQNLRPESIYRPTGSPERHRQGLPKTMMAGVLVAALGLGGMLSLLVVAIRERQARLRREEASAHDHSHS